MIVRYNADLSGGDGRVYVPAAPVAAPKSLAGGNGRMLVVLQFYHEEEERLRELVRLLVDLAPSGQKNTDVMLSARYDTTAPKDVVENLKRKFNVWVHVCRRQAVGWPFGPNEQWFDTVTRINELRRTRVIPQYDCILTTETDTCPMVVDWDRRLHAAYLRAGKSFVGCLVKAGTGSHINGNMMISGSPKILDWIARKGGCRANEGWDSVLSNEFQSLGWAGIPEIMSLWRYDFYGGEYREEFVDTLLDSGVAWFHGCKTLDLLKLMRGRLVGRTIVRV